MSNSFVQLPPDSSGKSVDASSLNVGASTVQRQRIIIGDNTGTASYATCMGTTPVGTEGALVVRNIPSGVQTIVQNATPQYNTASQGPKCVTLSTSAAVALIAAPGAGLCVYITKIASANGSATLTRGDVYGGSATSTAMASLYMAASGGGFVMDYNPPIKTLSNTAVNARVKPAVSKCMFNVHFYVAPK
jgi:hypothetical protein